MLDIEEQKCLTEKLGKISLNYSSKKAPSGI